MSVGSDSTGRGTTGVSFSEFFGLGDRYRMDAAFSMAVRQDIIDDPSKLALASLDTAAAAGIPALTTGDNSGANALIDLADSKLSFLAAGNLPSITTSLSEYAGYYLSALGMEASQLQSMSDDREALASEIRNRRDSLSGVNIDEELANMIIYQNAYNAAARLITTANEMFDTLLTISG
jgi:flagellar hook-associated protein 1 FlgK